MPVTYSWPIASPPGVPAVETTVDAAALLAAGNSARSRRGLILPFDRNGISDFANATGRALISSAIQQVVATRATSAHEIGEVPWRSAFGSVIHLARHQNNTIVLEESVRQWVLDSFARWLSFVRATDIRIARVKDPDGNETIMVVRIAWIVPGTGGEVLGEGTTDVPIGAISA